MSSGKQPSRALLIAAGLLTQLIGATCFVLGLASIPVIHDLKGGMSGVIASVIASLAAIVCGTLVWRGRLVPLALAAGLDVGFGIGLPRGGSAVGAMLRMLPADEASTAETFVMVAAVVMFVAAILCVISVPQALKLRQWARDEIAAAEASGTSLVGIPSQRTHGTGQQVVDEVAPTRERPRLDLQPGMPDPRYSQPPDPRYSQPPDPRYSQPPDPRYSQPPAGIRPSAPLPLPPPPDTQPGGTLRGFSAQKLMPTQVLNIGPAKKGGKPAIIIGVAITLIAIGIIVISAASGTGPEEKISAKGSADEVTSVISGSANEPSISTGNGTGKLTQAAAGDGGLAVEEIAPAAPPQPIEEFIENFHAAVGKASATELGPMIDEKAFAFGVDANDLAEGRDAVVKQLQDDLGSGGTVNVRFVHRGQDADSAWLAEELKVGSKVFVITAALALRDNRWSIGALHWAEPMPNATAYRLAREGNLSVPDVIPNTNDDSELAKVMKTAFASKPSFVDARSARPEAFNFGSASGERLKGGESIRKIFGRINAVIRLHDAVKVGALGANGGWGIANVDFTDADRDGTEVTQTFRVLAVWVKESAGWRIVQTQFSNPR